MRAALATLSLENLLHNLNVIKNQAPRSAIIAMIKANAYGHGLRSTALRLEKHVFSFGVASIDEALALRRVGIKIPITLMEGVFEPDEIPLAAHENFHVVFHAMHQIDWLKSSTFNNQLTVWLKVDTGMGRLGFSLHEAQGAFNELMHCKHVQKPIGLMSHFACADEPQHPLNVQQINNFTSFIQDKGGPKSFCNSAALFAFSDQHYDAVRPGLSLYGVSPFATLSAAQLDLKPVMTLQTRLMALREVKKGSSLGYGARFVCERDMRIGVLAMGYGDGYPRTARDGTPVLIKGLRCPLVGRVSMDMITVDVTECSDVNVGDPVILWGDGLPIEEIAQHTEQSPYDMLTAVQARVKFQWTG